jgi:hypothetical protein
VVPQDILIGGDPVETVSAIRTRPMHVVVLAPRADVVQRRDAARRSQRGKLAHGPGDRSVIELDAQFRADTPTIGLWLDTSDQTIEQTADEVLARVFTDAAV